MNDVPRLVTTKSDQEKAIEHKQAIIEASKPFVEALTRARAEGFVANINFGEDAFQRIMIVNFMLMKQF